MVKARGREWVVLPDSTDELLLLRPLGGGDADVAGVLRGIEPVESATFAWPSSEDRGDDRSARLLRDALRIGFRSTGGPFRSLAGLAVDPRPFQLVPLLLALRQDPVRLLIADDVGIGKTVEAGLVASELLAQGDARGLTVLCPPSLAEQWAKELAEKFNLDAEIVLPGTVTRLERQLEYGQSLFERFPVTVVSTDFIKADRRRDDFVRSAPDLVIVDEAHTSVSDGKAGSRGRTQRFRLLQELAKDAERNLVLVTATPHSGKDEAFRNLLGLLDESLINADLSADEGRARLATHMVQRRRRDIREYLGAETRFPRDRKTQEVSYSLAPAYKELFEDVLAYVRERVSDRSGTRLEQRVRWWSALSLLRALASSPRAAAATLRTRARAGDADTAERADEVGQATVLDPAGDETSENADLVAGAVAEDQEDIRARRMLREFHDRVAELTVEDDTKLTTVTKLVKQLLKDGFQPIVFCRFIQTAHYVAEHLRTQLERRPLRAAVDVVTGELAPEDRQARVERLASAEEPNLVLVATDALSEGVNLQESFQAVVHYDLAWNPTRHEQREGRVDRFGQTAEVVRAATVYGADNGIDGLILQVLLRKHEAISRDLGVSVPVPSQSDQVMAALVEGLLMRGRDAGQMTLDLEASQQRDDLHAEWDSTAEREKLSRTRYAQRSIKDTEVRRELEAARAAMGDPGDVAAFVRTACEELGLAVVDDDTGFTVEPHGLPLGLRDALGRPDSPMRFDRDLPASTRHASVLRRTDTRVGALAGYVLDAALDPALPAEHRPARRCSVVRTDAVTVPTTVLLARFRLHVTLPSRSGERVSVAEEARTLAYTGLPNSPTWLPPDEVDALLAAGATANTPGDVARNMASAVLEKLPAITPELERFATELAAELRETHARVRRAARGRTSGVLGVSGLAVTPQLPVDVLGAYLYLPAGGAQ
ncbi:DEAD/DEAH box helicase [Allosaccharopolyspora coralli]|uniref:DEAD/DEAH box helicase n=1 Tax=Allosaccharopolyspora coralli TaxID=2665642 RepID=A0A5Q3QM05_9PSEU|nr:DEAD/DEAH box helicase [Allosaccharopolyspora coralli]